MALIIFFIHLQLITFATLESQKVNYKIRKQQSLKDSEKLTGSNGDHDLRDNKKLIIIVRTSHEIHSNQFRKVYI